MKYQSPSGQRRIEQEQPFGSLYESTAYGLDAAQESTSDPATSRPQGRPRAFK